MEHHSAVEISPGYPSSIAPPRYSIVFADPEERLPVNTVPTQHEVVLRSGIFKPKPWGTLRIFSRPSKFTKKHPLFFGGDDVAGIIDLKINSSQIINSITIMLKGQIVTSFAEGGSYTFLEHSEKVWNKLAGNPQSSGAGAGTNASASSGKLTGELGFPFSFPFPVTVDFSTLSSIKGKNRSLVGTTYQTPQTFLEHNIPVNIEYELVLQIVHGGLRLDSKLKARVRFIPEITPDPSSGIRQLAYRENTSLSGPESDPEGWQPLPRVLIPGILFQTRSVNLEYCLYLAKPLCYTRGTVIPCYLLLASQDHQSLDYLANPKVQYVRLTRHIKYLRAPAKGLEQFLQGKKPDFLEKIDEAELAIWWVPPKDVLQEPYLKRLEGEIHLAKELAPSSDFLLLSVEYYVEVLPFFTSTFESFVPSGSEMSRKNSTRVVRSGSPEKDYILLSYPVTIATFKAAGPPQTAFTKRQRPSLAHRHLTNAEGVPNASDTEYGLWLKG